ncbi:MAG: hypothetical protein INH43_25260 [Acidobacteriaceae bacterium]|nr:hypothetical protein [Acidobacteriaceae bacterium]
MRFIEYTGGNAFYRHCTAGESELVPCGVREVCALSLAAGFRPDLPGWLPALAGRVFHELHLMEHGGSGIRRMNAACEEEGLPMPSSKKDENILFVLRQCGSAGTAAIAKQVGLSSRTRLNRLNALRPRGVVVEIATGPHDPKRRYALATTGR